MMLVLILALFFAQGLAFDKHNQLNVTVDSKIEDHEADDHDSQYLHNLERRAISSSEL